MGGVHFQRTHLIIMDYPRLIIAALKGGSGKTILSLGLTAAWRGRGLIVAPFKKGPDFIDSGWLDLAAGRACYNLDPFLMTEREVLESFLVHSAGADISLIEGNRGLYDGLDIDGCCSTAELGKMLKAPVILIADVTMSTRTIAAVILGCQRFDPGLNIAAVILNRVAGARQENLIREAVERYCGIPVIGAVPKLKGEIFPERHMGLVPHQERDRAEKAVAWAKKTVEDHLDLDALWAFARKAEPLEPRDLPQKDLPSTEFMGLPDSGRPRIGYIRDDAFWFYYPENLDQLKDLGARLVAVNAIRDKKLPLLDALVIGGGFPETQAEVLARNQGFRDSLKKEIERGLPVYAECGGFMYLGRRLVVGANAYPMVGTLPIDFILEKKPQGHGYTILEVTRENPYFPVRERVKGHEFHYSRPVIAESEKIQPVFKVLRGRGIDGQRDGLCTNNLLATYTHLHAAGNRMWAKNLFKIACLFMTGKK